MLCRYPAPSAAADEVSDGRLALDPTRGSEEFLFFPRSVIHLPSFTYHWACTGEQDYVRIVISWLFRVSSKAIAAHLHVLNLKKVHFLAVNEG